MCIYGRVECAYMARGGCVHMEMSTVCPWGEGGHVHMEVVECAWSVRAWGEEGRVHMEGVECACMHGERMCVYVCIWKGWSVRAWVCAYERVECARMGSGRVCILKGREGGCIYGMGGVCVHEERVGVCIWKGWSVRVWGEGECIWKGLSAWTRRGMMRVYGSGGVCVHANSAPNHLTLSYLCKSVPGSQDYAYPNSRGHNINFSRQHQLTY